MATKKTTKQSPLLSSGKEKPKAFITFKLLQDNTLEIKSNGQALDLANMIAHVIDAGDEMPFSNILKFAYELSYTFGSYEKEELENKN